MVDVKFERKGIEEILNQKQDDFTAIEVKLNDERFIAYITPVTYGELPKNQKNFNEYELGQKILLKHLYKSDKTLFNEEDIKLFPIGWVTEITEAIMKISGFDKKPDDIKDF